MLIRCDPRHCLATCDLVEESFGRTVLEEEGICFVRTGYTSLAHHGDARRHAYLAASPPGHGPSKLNMQRTAPSAALHDVGWPRERSLLAVVLSATSLRAGEQPGEEDGPVRVKHTPITPSLTCHRASRIKSSQYLTRTTAGILQVLPMLQCVD